MFAAVSDEILVLGEAGARTDPGVYS